MVNYYEILGLPCDGESVHDTKLIDRTLKQWEMTKTSALSSESNEAKRKALQAELAELPKMKGLLTDAELRKSHADSLKSERMVSLESIINIMVKCSTGGKSISNVRAARMAQLIGLRSKTIEDCFKTAGYTVVIGKKVSTGDFIIGQSVLNKIEGSFKLIRGYMASHPLEPMQELAKVTDLYEYIAVMEGKSIADAKDYEIMQTDKLAAKFGTKVMEHTKSVAPIMWYKTIEAEAKAQIMKNEKQREKYDNALKLKKLSLLELLPSVPVSIKLESSFAEECIREIQTLFTEEQAIAIYNMYGGMPNDSQYEKESTSIATMCTCHIINYHNTRQEAEKAKCVSCGKDLYETCPSCKNKVPVVSEFCSCGFFMKGRQVFELHRLRFAAAIKSMDLSKAQDEYNQAMLCDPMHAMLASMNAEIQKLQKELGKPIEEIENAINAKNIFLAQQKINALKAARPSANLEKYQKQVKTELTWAAAEYEKLKRAANLGDAVVLASGIIERVKDHAQTLEWLRQHKPSAVKTVVTTGDDSSMSCAIQWVDDPNNRFVNYTIVRKEGAKPLNPVDGVRIAEGLKTTQFRDENLKPGKLYAYAVFAVRGDASSPPAYGSVIFLKPNVTKVQANIAQGMCTLSWQDVPGSSGVRITRSEDGGKTYSLVSASSRTSFSDTKVINGKIYIYSIRTLWSYGGKEYISNNEVTRKVQVEQKPQRVDLQLENVGADGNCRVRWNGTGGGTICIVSLKSGVCMVPDQVYHYNVIQSMGSIIAQAIPVAAQEYSWYAEKGRQYRIAAFRSFGDDFVGSKELKVSTVPKPIIDENKTVIVADTLHLYLENVPAQVSKICYMVSVNGEVCTEQSALQNGLRAVSAADYAHSGMIMVAKLPPEELTVSMIMVYGSGMDAYCSPVTVLKMSNLPKQQVRYWIEWKTKGTFRKTRVRSGAKLHVSTSGWRLPEMMLCCREDGKVIFNYSSIMSGIVQLLKIEAEERSEAEYIIPEENMDGVPENADIQLFLAPKEMNNYELPMMTEQSGRKMPAR